MLDSVFAWATGKRRTPKSYGPDQVKVAFRRHLGRGWYGVEDDTSGVRVWSRNIAEIRITPDVTRVTLGFTTHYHEWTGSPQVVTFAKDGSHYLTLRVTRERVVVTIKCKGNHLISIRPATVKPSEFEKTSDSRAVGICLDHLVVEPRQIPAIAEEPEKLLCTRELNPTGIPHTLQVEITSACNLRCRMCVNHAPTNPKLWRIGAHMNEVLWEKVRLLLPQADVLVFMGDGEVFTHPKFLEYLEEADRFGVRTVFHTNGQLLRGG